ncbi:MAG TPA: hypothetical protein VJB57_07515 [Dehalococcoidia bacterium]|nr:hypothetical protein [Dehalococcoidia bacterium]
MSEPLVLASVLYWAVYGIAIAIGIPVALALLFGIVQTAKWFKKGGKTNPHRHSG